ncbi:hypothetical protein H5410_058227 [Solanum commersonii]|uniref:Lactoylglutathione lyase n=1 Tax=Solanum commersonii TaxID=4109 RepID=A0A9J5WS14_SOLCO|nr:hypothetical protein H5410_058227 [Solanum commersonii]
MKGIAFIKDPDGYWIEIFDTKLIKDAAGALEASITSVDQLRDRLKRVFSRNEHFRVVFNLLVNEFCAMFWAKKLFTSVM